MTDIRFVGSGRLMAAGSLQPLIDAFIAELQVRRHTSLTVSSYEDSARHFADWLCRNNIELGRIDEDIVQSFAGHRCRCPGSRRQDHVSAKYVRRVRRFLGFLADREVLPVVAAPSLPPGDARIAAYQDWLRHHRGICERTIDRHGRMIMRLLPGLGADPGVYDAALIRRVIIDEAKRSSRAHVKTMTTALRGYLRFLAATGLCRSGLDHAVPTIPQWRLSALPRYLPGGEQGPRIHDLRHSFAVRSLESCRADREAVARHIAALSTYLGHGHVTDTYWYLEATPILMRQIAEASETFHKGGAA